MGIMVNFTGPLHRIFYKCLYSLPIRAPCSSLAPKSIDKISVASHRVYLLLGQPNPIPEYDILGPLIVVEKKHTQRIRSDSSSRFYVFI